MTGVAQCLLQNLQAARLFLQLIPPTTGYTTTEHQSGPVQSFPSPVRQMKFLIDGFSEVTSSSPTGEKKEKAKYKEKAYFKNK